MRKVYYSTKFRAGKRHVCRKCHHMIKLNQWIQYSSENNNYQHAKCPKRKL